MPRRFNNFKSFVERLVLTTIIIGFVILVGVQMILTNPNFKDSLIAKIPKIEHILAFGQREDFKEKAQAVFSTVNQKDYVVISLQNKASYPDAKVIINGQVIGDFGRGYIKVNIEAGDYLTIDTRGIGAGLWFEVTGISNGVESFKIGQQFWVKDELKTLGKVENLNKF
ncbi:hypothetical protein U472_08570 [Orenia metallireducens]|uniref:Uncharacterized protein n=1 Tax=Orenia metallireducens TaxID=1413210 RepID=A0A1C0A758_9FIRM|nr:hypothetical protein [Orenia metallireducens]OCL26062.1 hypothetical protein U472_08570 [Orenia metallireducens]